MRFWAALVFASAALGQNAPRFVSASLKLTDQRVDHSHDPIVVHGQQVECHNVTPTALVYEGWHLPSYEVVWPEGSAGVRYNVSATMRKGTTADQRSLMFQQLLKERFGFRYHWQPKDLPIYAIEIAPGGLKMSKAAAPPSQSIIIGKVENNSWHMFRVAHAPSTDDPASRMSHLNVYSIDELIAGLRPMSLQFTDRPVVNQTGLKGYFGVDLYVPCPLNGCKTKEWSDAVFFDVLEKQLGLRVEKKTIPVKMLVIEHLERVPTEN